MIARLRRRFILIAMGSVILVLVVLVGIINVANFTKMDQSSTEILQLLSANNGGFPETEKPAGGQTGNSGTHPAPGVSETGSSFTAGGGSGPVGPRSLSPETPYETRYFSVALSESGTLLSVNTGKIAAVSTDEAVSMAQDLSARDKTSGYLGNYKYLATATAQGRLYVFLDCTRDLDSAWDFFSTSLLVSLCGILAVFVLVLIFSRRAIRPVAESYDKQKQFITNAGHEIKTPLTIIDSCTEVIELEQGESKWTEGIRGQVKRLTALTQSLVSLARMDEGGADLPMADFSLSDAAAETLEPFVLLAENKGMGFSLDIQPGITYHGNEQTLRQLCSILADNAVKYALSGSEIRFSLLKKGKRPVLTCENAAEGLEKGSQEILFDRFYRGDASRGGETGGYGIGLSMAQAIVSAHGGKIYAKSEDGTSLTITVQL